MGFDVVPVFYGVGCSHVVMCEVLPGVLKFTAGLWHTWQQSTQGPARNGPRNRVESTTPRLVIYARHLESSDSLIIHPYSRSSTPQCKKKKEKASGSSRNASLVHKVSDSESTICTANKAKFLSNICINLVRAPCLPLNSLIILLFLAGPRVCGYRSGVWERERSPPCGPCFA
jgi:hypothetical protein